MDFSTDKTNAWRNSEVIFTSEGAMINQLSNASRAMDCMDSKLGGNAPSSSIASSKSDAFDHGGVALHVVSVSDNACEFVSGSSESTMIVWSNGPIISAGKDKGRDSSNEFCRDRVGGRRRGNTNPVVDEACGTVGEVDRDALSRRKSSMAVQSSWSLSSRKTDWLTSSGDELGALSIN